MCAAVGSMLSVCVCCIGIDLRRYCHATIHRIVSIPEIRLVYIIKELLLLLVEGRGRWRELHVSSDIFRHDGLVNTSVVVVRRRDGHF